MNWTDWGNDGPYCSALACPRIKNPEMEDRLSSSEMGTDMAGNYWCNHCWKHLEIMNWASINHWPAVRVQGKMRYAVAAGAQSWHLSVVGASEDMIEALHETLVLEQRAPLPPGEDSEGVKRVKQFIEMVEKKPAKGEED